MGLDLLGTGTGTGRGYRGSVYGFGFGSPWLCYRHRFRSLGRSQFICHTRQSSLWSQSANGQAAASANHVGDNFVVPLAPSCWAPSPVTHTHGQRKQSTCEASEPNDQVHFGLYCSANLGAKSLDKGWTDRPGPPRPVSFGPFDRESFLPQNRSNACAEPISEGILYPLPTHVNQIRNWHRVRSQLKMLISVN